MKVSIIIPIRNRVENTKKLLDELTRQQKEFPQTEIICIENGSTEDMSFLNDYDSIIDNDDWIPDYYLRVIYNNIDSNKDWYVWKWYSDSTPVTMKGLDIKHPLKLNWAMWGYCMSRKLFDGIVFNESVPAGDDIRVMFQIITEDTDGAFIDEFMYRFKWIGNDDSISHRYNAGQI